MPSITECGLKRRMSRSLAGAGLGFVRVAEDVLLHVALRHEGPLQTGRKACAAAAAQVALLESRRSKRRIGLLGEDLLPRLVATRLAHSCPSTTACRNAAWCRRPDVPGVRVRLPLRLPLLETVENLIDLLGRELLVVMTIDRHRRRTRRRQRCILLRASDRRGHPPCFRQA